LIIDRTHSKWALGSLFALMVSAIVYALLRPAPGKLVGGTALGITYGSIGFALILIAGLLGAREKVPAWRIGRLQSWMRAHLWLGLLSFPIILMHGGLVFGHGLTRVLMILFTIVIVSGVLGAALQHFLPRRMTHDLPMETTFEQIDRVCEQLVKEGEDLIAALAPPPPKAKTAAAPAAGVATSEPSGGPLKPAVGLNGEVAVAEPPSEDPHLLTLRACWDRDVLPYLQPRALGQRGPAYTQVQGALVKLRTLLPPPMHDTVSALQEICSERAQLAEQRKLHYWLHGWLFVHVPLSYALLLLAVVHAVDALRY